MAAQQQPEQQPGVNIPAAAAARSLSGVRRITPERSLSPIPEDLQIGVQKQISMTPLVVVMAEHGGRLHPPEVSTVDTDARLQLYDRLQANDELGEDNILDEKEKAEVRAVLDSIVERVAGWDKGEELYDQEFDSSDDSDYDDVNEMLANCSKEEYVYSNLELGVVQYEGVSISMNFPDDEPDGSSTATSAAGPIVSSKSNGKQPTCINFSNCKRKASTYPSRMGRCDRCWKYSTRHNGEERSEETVKLGNNQWMK